MKESRGAIVLLISMLAVLALGAACKKHIEDGPLPETFGVYYESEGTLHEIPVGGKPSHVKATKDLKDAFATHNKDVIGESLRKWGDSCEKVGPKMVLVVYSEDLKPALFHLQKTVNKQLVDVEVGVAPMPNKPSMYKLIPKEPLTEKVYLLAVKNEFQSQTWDCFTVK